ncbi:MAG: NSS family neurotransmitter:Na+ symporter [Woeseiaceae bacterium]|jgi:NSS family neurotransmitter:Na+ symporter
MAGASGSGEQWSSRWGFLLASVGFAVGMGNIWRFPYVLGENGGSAFLFIYLAFALGIGLPLFITEISIGRRGKSSATGSYRAVAAECGKSRAWGHVGTLGIFCAFVVLSYYTVISGWTLDYFVKAAGGTLNGVGADESSALFAELLSNPVKLLVWNTVVHLLIIFVIRRGVQGGIEKAVKILMPALFASLIFMVIYGAVAGDMAAALKFLLEPDFSKVTLGTAMMAIGQAFFSIGIGMGSLVVFGSYMPQDFSIGRSATAVILLDTGVAVVAGLAIFPLVFHYGLDAGSGAGLIFQTLPMAFGQMAGGQIVGSIFFVLLISAALSSCIGLAEGVVNWVDEHWGIARQKGVLYVVGAAWLLGILSIFSLGDWSTYYPLDFVPSYGGKNIFNALDHLAANNLLLVGGALSAIFFGWLVPKALKLDEMGVSDGVLFGSWRFLIRFVIPPILFVVLAGVFLGY